LGMLPNQDHHPDIRAALDVLTESTSAAAGRVSAALRVLLRRSYASGGPQAWSFSRLTGDGFPLEFAFTTSDAQLRYTADPGGFGLPAAENLDDAVGLLAELGQPAPDPRLLAHLKASQQSATRLSYGVWVGGRHVVAPGNNRHAPADCFKLYVEMPESSLESHLPFITTYLNLPSRMIGRPVQLRMVGLEPTTGRIEFYFRIRHLQAGALPLLLQSAGLQQRAGELTDFIEQAYGHPLTERIPGGSVGFSYSLIPGSETIGFTLFLFTRLLWGGDVRIRSRFGERLQEVGQDPSAYWRFSAPLAKRDVYETYHGLLGLTMGPHTPIHLTLGVRPPPCRTDEH
jgi:hypothetical protein